MSISEIQVDEGYMRDGAGNGTLITLEEAQTAGYIYAISESNVGVEFYMVNPPKATTFLNTYPLARLLYKGGGIADEPKLVPFPLSNIEDMKDAILAQDKASPLLIDKDTPLPYGAVTRQYGAGFAPGLAGCYMPMTGLLVKCYKSDRFNNWLRTEWIEGPSSIAEITKIDVRSGYLDQNSLLAAQAVFNMLNRVAMTDGTLSAYEKVNYGITDLENAFVPIYVGGITSRIVFDQVISTAETEAGVLGELGGRGKEIADSTHTVRAKCKTASWIMGIASITPILDYSQGNKWFGRFKSFADIHKPAYDGIGYQDLLTDELAAWNTKRDADGNPTYMSAGKQPAWIEWERV